MATLYPRPLVVRGWPTTSTVEVGGLPDDPGRARYPGYRCPFTHPLSSQTCCFYGFRVTHLIEVYQVGFLGLRAAEWRSEGARRYVS